MRSNPVSELATEPGTASADRGAQRSKPGRPTKKTGQASPGDGASPVAPGRLSTPRLIAVFATLLLLPPIIAGLLSSAQPPTYAAQVDVLYRNSDTTGSTIERELATQQVLLQSRALIAEVAEAAGRTPEDLAEDISVEVVEGSNVLRLQVEDQNPERAQEIARSLVDQYIAARQEQVAGSATSAQERDLLQQQVDGLTTRLDAVNTRVAEILEVQEPSTAAQTEQRSLEAEAQTVRQRLVELQSQLINADIRAVREGVSPARILSAPSVLDEPVAPQPLRAAAGGLLVGLLLALALAALLRVRHERSRHPAP
jgi:uncharacterized protein involved in exopolysaccharide biosynthesis